MATERESREPILTVRDLEKVYRGRRKGEPVHALDGVSLDLHAAETLGIVGESGSGKSTLARIVVRLVAATRGNVGYTGIDVLRPSRDEARTLSRHIQIVFQDPSSSMNPRMNVRQVLDEGIRATGDGDRSRQSRRIRAEELLDMVHLPGKALDVYPHELSGGQRQRVAIARALSVRPRIVVADECVSALDVSMQSAVLNLLLEIQRELGLSYLFISHDLQVVRHVSDRMIVMERGRIVEHGDPDRLYAEPQHRYTTKLLAAIPGIEHIEL